MKRLMSGIRFIICPFLIGSVNEIQTGGQNILMIWDLTLETHSAIIKNTV